MLVDKTTTYYRIKVIPKAPRNEIMGLMDDGETLKIKIKAVPEKGKANLELIKFLAKGWGVSKRDITIISGQKDRIKLIRIKKNKN